MNETIAKNREQVLAMNPFRAAEEKPQVADARALTENQLAYIAARRFPREIDKAVDRILTECCQQQVAELALYSYPRGGETITGPSIRLAEVLARNFGNVEFGIQELETDKTSSLVRSYCVDLETNTTQSKIFRVPHVRHTRKGKTLLSDPRDIYEHIANFGARRLRACILGIIPQAVTSAAVDAVHVTLANLMGAPPDALKAMLEAFQEVGVTRDMIREKLGHSLESVNAAEVIMLRGCYRSLKDGMTSVRTLFPVKQVTDASAMETAIENAKE